MAAEDILKQYLIAIGFDIPKEEFKKSRDVLGDVTKMMEEVGAAAVSASAVITASVINIAGKLEKLFYSTQKTGSSAGNLRAFGIAASQVGVSADSAQAAVENMARTIRNSPGLRGLFPALGLDPRETDTVKTFLALLDKLAALSAKGPIGQATALQYGKMFGIDDDTLYLLMKNLPELHKQFAELAAQQPINDAQTAKAREFMNQLRKLEARFEGLTFVLGSRLLPVGEKVIDFLNKTLDVIEQLDSATNGWSTSILAVVAALGGAVTAMGLLRGAKALLGLGGAAEATAATGTAATAAQIAGGVAGAGAAAVAGGGLGYWILRRLAGDIDIRTNAQNQLNLAQNKLAMVRGETFKRETGKGPNEDPLGWARWQAAHPLPGQAAQLPPLKDTSTLNNPGNLREWGDFPRVQVGDIGKFAKFPDAMTGLGAMAGNLLAYNREGINTLSTIIAKWAPKSDKNDTAAYIADVAKNTGFNPKQVLNLQDPHVLESLMQSMIRHEKGYDPYDTKLISSAAEARLAQSKDIHISQKTEINVNGTGHPADVARQVTRSQQQVNNDMIRNTAGAVR